MDNLFLILIAILTSVILYYSTNSSDNKSSISMITPFASTTSSPSLPTVVENSTPVKSVTAITAPPMDVHPLTTTTKLDPISSSVGTNSKITNLPSLN
jgi:hypothetical protein